MNLYLLHFCYDQLPPPTGQLENLGTNPLYMEQRHGRVTLEFEGTLEYESDVLEVEHWIQGRFAVDALVSNVQLLGWQLLAGRDRPDE